MDFLKLWNDGGYGEDNELSVSIERIKRHGKEKNVSLEAVDSIIVDFFTQIQIEPKKYLEPIVNIEVFDEKNKQKITLKTRKCVCGCTIGNSGTNFIHSIFKEIEKASIEQAKDKSKVIAKSFEKRVKAYVRQKEQKTKKIRLIILTATLIITIIAGYYYGFYR